MFDYELTRVSDQERIVSGSSYSGRGGKFYSVLVFENGDTVEEGTNGDLAWRIDAQGAHVLEGEAKARAIREADFTGQDWRTHYSKVETVSLAIEDRRPVYKVVLTPKTGSPVTRFYDKQSGFLVREASTLSAGNSEFPSTVTEYTSRWKWGDLIFADERIVTSRSGLKIRMVLKNVRFNQNLPANVFRVPEKVRALIQPPSVVR